jgi:hypothetical protein
MSISPTTQQALDKLVSVASALMRECEFYLAGGTALALQLNHRTSYDLDIFSPQTFDAGTLQQRLQQLFPGGKEWQTSHETVRFQLDGVEVSFFGYHYPLVGDLVAHPQMPLASIADIGCMKVTAAADRALYRDFFDIYHICLSVGGLKTLMQFFEKKYPQSSVYHYIKSLSLVSDCKDEPPLATVRPIRPEAIKEYLLNELKNYL